MNVSYLTFLGLILTLIPQTHAQNRANHWYFYRKAGLVFNGGNPTPILDARMDITTSYPALGKEAAACISDTAGNLLFYTNGIYSWDRSRNVLENGLGLKAHWSVAQGVIIVPHPGNEDQYYIFTLGDPVGTFSEPNKGFNYSVVDMTLNNGLGAVSSLKNLEILPNVSFSEKMTAIQSWNANLYWLVCRSRFGNKFHSFPINTSGFQASPVISETGANENLAGSLVFSPSGRMLAQTIYGGARVELLDFDQSNGKVALRHSIYNDSLLTCYGVCFSPNEDFLYITGGYQFSEPAIFQLDLRSSDPQQIQESLTRIYTYPETSTVEFTGALQIGPNEKIYVGLHDSDALGVINFPNNPAASCGYDPFGQSLGGRISSISLPNFVVNFTFDNCQYLPPVSIGKDTTICFADSLELTPKDPFTSITWQDGTQGPAFTVKQPGTFMAEIDRRGCLSYDTVTISYYPEIHNDLGPDVILCPGEALTLTAQEAGAQYLWQDGSTETVHLAKEAGTYWLQTTQGLCSLRDSMHLSFEELPTLDLGRDTTIYSVDALTIDATVEDVSANYLWSDGLGTPQREITQTGHYQMEIEINGCFVRDSVQIEVVDLIIPNLISPNGDGINERFVIHDSGFERWKLDIVDRYGRPVYQSQDYQDDWSGDGVREGTYYYALVDQITGRVFKGWVLVIR